MTGQSKAAGPQKSRRGPDNNGASEARKPRILIALHIVGVVTDSKRISMLQEAGFEVEAIAFERDFHKGRQPSCPVRTVGRIEHGRYIQRAAKMLAALPTIRRAIRSHDMIYASGADMALTDVAAGQHLSDKNRQR